MSELYLYNVSCGTWDIDYEDYYVVSDQKYSTEEFESMCKKIIEEKQRVNSPKDLSLLLAQKYGFFVPSTITDFHLKDFSQKQIEKEKELKKVRRLAQEYANKPKNYFMYTMDELSEELQKADMGKFKCFMLETVDVGDFYCYEDHQYVTTEFLIRTNKSILDPNTIAKELFDGAKMYPVIDTYMNGEIYKVALNSNFGNYHVEQRGVLIEQIQ
ncbi:hypothetical protein ACFVQB_14105 [Paenibacillus sp. NPDC057886]|uniref:hypothetical protein n=1 Tax=Paenibacillus sp. NPDC057886 TaxID=3346270 RepID=UPI0036A9A507